MLLELLRREGEEEIFRPDNNGRAVTYMKQAEPSRASDIKEPS
jgi:hypothetical protein